MVECVFACFLCATSVVFIYIGVFVHPCVSVRSNITARFQILTHCCLITSFSPLWTSDMLFLRLSSISSTPCLIMLYSYSPFLLLSSYLLILRLLFVHSLYVACISFAVRSVVVNTEVSIQNSSLHFL